MSSAHIPPDHLAFLLHAGGAIHESPLIVDGQDRVAEIGRLGSLPVWSVVCSPAEALRLAKRMVSTGALGLLFAYDHSRQRHLVLTAVAPVRATALSSGRNNPLVIRRLAMVMRSPGDSPLQLAVRCAEAIDVDAAGRRTFRLLHQLLDEGIGLLPGRMPREDRHGWLLTQLTRLLFLRFVEAEGWLSDNPRFLQHHFDRCLSARRDPFRHFLQPLFFGTLNRPATQRLRVAREFGAIPFLNGGLFEPHQIERRHDPGLPASYWQSVFEAVTGRIEVTLDRESAGGEVTPEMLGRVFEGVMDSGARKASGAFYTPPALVLSLVREGLIPVLADRLHAPESAIADRLDQPDVALRRAMLGLRILDPAVGSGAFLIGALDLLHGPGARHPSRVRHLVTRTLHGVDRHPGAVRITELRLWLEVLRSFRGASPQQVPPLPNLDATVRAGDALLDPMRGPPTLRSLAHLARQQQALQHAHGLVKRRLLAEMRCSERAALESELHLHEARLQREVNERLDAGRAVTLFGEATGLDRNARKDIAALRQQWRDVRRESRALARDTSSAPFACAVAFGPVLARHGGFDLVIGNPPWIRAERIPMATRRALGQRYHWWRSTSSSGFQHLPDLAVAFVERSLELLRPRGTMALLLPAKLATTRYAIAMREGLSRQTTLHCVADLAEDPRATFQATTYPMALIASRMPAPAAHRVRLGLTPSSPAVPQQQWARPASWALGAPAARDLAERLALEYPLLHQQLVPQLGVKTGANAVFMNPPGALEAWTRPAMRGRDIGATDQDALPVMLWPADRRGQPWPVLPEPVAEYLAPYQQRLRRRADHRGPCWWQLFRTTAATSNHRVAWSDIARTLRVRHLPDDRVVPLNSCYVVALPSAEAALALQSWLNCRWLRALARLSADPAAQRYARFNARVVGTLPLPAMVLTDRLLIDLARELPSVAIRQRIDAHVADLLSLDAHDCAILAPLAADHR